MSWISECYLSRINQVHYILLEVEFVISKTLFGIFVKTLTMTWYKYMSETICEKKAFSGTVLRLLFDL